MGSGWYEEPGDPLDFGLHAKIAGDTSRPWHRRESVFGPGREEPCPYGGLRPDGDVLQLDPALSYGLWCICGSS